MAEIGNGTVKVAELAVKLCFKAFFQPCSKLGRRLVSHRNQVSSLKDRLGCRRSHAQALRRRSQPLDILAAGCSAGHLRRTALVIGDSFYHAFLPYMTPYYDRILAMDPRDEMYNPNTVGPDISTYMRQYDIDDIYFVTCTYTSVNGNVFQDRLERHLYEDSAAAG